MALVASDADIVFPFCTKAKVKRQPSLYRLQPHALRPLMSFPCEHCGQVRPIGNDDSGRADGDVLVFVLGRELFVLLELLFEDGE